MMRDILFSFIHDIGTPLILRRSRIRNKEVSVLMFHRVSDEYDPFWPSLPIKTFRRLMKELCSKARVIALENIEKVDEYPDKPLVALSFDDGYLDFWENAVPILADFKLPCHHNICPELIDKGIPPWTQILDKFLQYSADRPLDLPGGKVYGAGFKFRQSDFIDICKELNSAEKEIRANWIESLLNKIPESKITRLMNWGHIRECARLGIHIGSHGMSHINISKIQDKNALLAEIKDCRIRIHKEIGIEPAIFAFPQGSCDPLSICLVKESGYKIALLCDDMVTRFTGNEHKDFYIFPRIGIYRSNWKEENLRLLGFHQRLKIWIKKAPYIFEEP